MHTIGAVIDAEIAALQALRNSALMGRIDAACHMVSITSGAVVVTGMGKAGLVARKVAATLSSTGTPAIFLDPAQSAHGDMGMVRDGDVILGFSNSGKTAEVIHVFQHGIDMRLDRIIVTGRADSPLAWLADIAVVYPEVPEGCPIGRAPMASCVQQMCVGDAIAASLMAQRGFTEEDFLRFHHGGYLGAAISESVKVRAQG